MASRPSSTAARDAEVPARRPYDSPLRRQQTAETRTRILVAGAALVRELSTWDWRELTFRAVAERAGVSERTVFRHFGAEQELHRAVMRQLEIEAGVEYEGLALADLSEMARRVFAAMSRFASSVDHRSAPPLSPTLSEEDERRRLALLAAVSQSAPAWSDLARQQAAAVLDVLWNVPAYERLVVSWQLDRDDALGAMAWALDLLVEAVEEGRGPGPGASGPGAPGQPKRPPRD
jgi:AcrR family transcriptional regulator